MKRSPLKRRVGLKRTGGFRSNPRDKFGAVPVDIGDLHFDSKTEADRWLQLRMLEKAGAITDLELHPKVTLIAQAPKVEWKVDYRYYENGRWVYEDSKARPKTPRENLLIKLWRHFGPGLLRITGSKKQRFKTLQEVMPILK